MEKAIYIQLNIYAFLVCLILYLHQRKTKQEVLGKHAFEVLTISMMAIELLNVCSWLLEGNVFQWSNILYLIELHIQFGIQIVPNVYMLVYCVQSGRKNLRSTKRGSVMIAAFITIWTILTVANVFHPYLFWIDSQNVYYRLPAFYPVVGALLIFMISSLILCTYKYFSNQRTEKEYLYLIIMLIMSLTGTALQVATYYLEVVGLAGTLSYVYLYIFVQSKRDDKLLEQRAEAKNNALLSQIQPHFLYNSVGTIQYYCEEQPRLAREAIDEFATFLRGNLDSVMSKVPIYFADEMKHVNAYLHLEQMRKRDNLKVIYHLEEEDFFLPALTIQPVVENAVKYGIASRENGGTITISTKREENQIIITIQDDGIGMDIDQIEDISTKQDGRTHVGLLNVKKRLKNMVNGKIEIHSTKDDGTVVNIILPQTK